MRRSLLAIGAALGFVIAAAALILTSWAVINLVGPVLLPSQGGHSMTATDFASVAVAGATLILAAAT
ncbi:MAG TPA: hypothetical protein VJS19_02270, partial [Candidatus Dormibacteraeota bacterium]|nr:hypothetical protein [Candidatus Dormibacteraeota bacterium]